MGWRELEQVTSPQDNLEASVLVKDCGKIQVLGWPQTPFP